MAAAFAARLLALEGTKPAEAAFSGENGKIAFSNHYPGSDEVYTMNADGSEETDLSSNVAEDADPAFSPTEARSPS